MTVFASCNKTVSNENSKKSKNQEEPKTDIVSLPVDDKKENEEKDQPKTAGTSALTEEKEATTQSQKTGAPVPILEREGKEAEQLDKTGMPVLTNENALRIILNGHKMLCYIGYYCLFPKESSTCVEIGDDLYAYLDPTVDTYEKLDAYLGETFTGESFPIIKEQFGIKKVNGVLAVRELTIGVGILSWDQAKVVSIEQNGNSATVSVSIPSVYADELPEDQSSMITNFILVYRENKGWLIDSKTIYVLW